MVMTRYNLQIRGYLEKLPFHPIAAPFESALGVR